MAVDANILIFERTKEELRVGKSLPAAIEAGFNRAWNSILDSNVSSLITAMILFLFGTSTIRGFAPRPDHRRARLDVHRDHRDPDDPPRRRRQPWARKAGLYGVTEDEFLARPTGRGRSARARPARVFDIIGKRKWFFAFSLLHHHPGRDLHPAGPITGGAAGLQFAIDFTGGTDVVDPVRGRRTSRPSRSRPCSTAQGDEAVVTKSGDGFTRDPDQGRSPPARRAGPDAEPVRRPPPRPCVRVAAARRRPPAPAPAPARPRAPAPSAEASPSPSAVRGRHPPRPARRPSPSARPPRAAQLPTQGEIGDDPGRARGGVRPIAEQRSLSTVGAVVVAGPHLPGPDADPVRRRSGSSLWITLRFRDVKMGVTALVSLLHDVIVVVGIFAILGTFFGVQIDGLFVTRC